jgi:hypothetical protein
MFFSSSNLGLTKSTTTIDLMEIGFGRSKHTIKRQTTTLTSYRDANRITFGCNHNQTS